MNINSLDDEIVTLLESIYPLQINGGIYYSLAIVAFKQIVIMESSIHDQYPR